MDQESTRGCRRRRGQRRRGVSRNQNGACMGRRGNEGSPGGSTTTRALVAVGAFVAQDLRDPEGVARPLLRRTALRMAASGRDPVRRLGAAYLRADPPAPKVLPPATPFEQRLLPG